MAANSNRSLTLSIVADIDNLQKAFLDSLMKEDKQIAHLEVQKRWVDFESGWIEISVKVYEQVLDLPAPKE